MVRSGSARSTDARSGPEINGRPRPAPRARSGDSLIAFAASALVLLLLLIFILQNGQRTDVHFFGAHGQLPMGVALLLAAVFGVLLVTVHVTLRRIFALRSSTSRHRTPADPTRPGPAATPTGPAASRTGPEAGMPEARS
ncbi:Uncharacterized integral membrane protein [Micromonospora nigra]|uniref:Uncharacterized integral membrane protein n=1 Tax=Micromonospora nigra TaxID=145857 RepID=A0A1C6S754_9ACTN|nr:LapA family protein [Micromonospora nigra]SCL25322.1 Uncharacterized integral membrane protein [Micromonospora nigra]